MEIFFVGAITGFILCVGVMALLVYFETDELD